MSDYIEGEPCNLVLHESVSSKKSDEDKKKDYAYENDPRLKGMPSSLLDYANKIMAKWSDTEKALFSTLPEHEQQAEMLRLMKKYKV